MTLHRIEVPGGFPLTGFVDPTGAVVIEPRYTQATPFWEGRAAVHPPQRGWGLIDETGAFVVEPGRYTRIGFYAEGLCAVYEPERGWGFVDRDGCTVVGLPRAERRDRHPRHVRQGRLLLRRRRARPPEGPVGLIDVDGDLVVRHVIEHMLPHCAMRSGLVPTAIRDGYGYEWGYLDRAGALVIPHAFDAAGNFDDGIAAVRVGDVNACIDTRGAFVWRSD